MAECRKKLKYGDYWMMAFEFLVGFIIFAALTVTKTSWSYLDFAFVVIVVIISKIITAVIKIALKYSLKKYIEFTFTSITLDMFIYQFIYLVFSVVLLSTLILFFKIELFGPTFNMWDYLIARLFTMLLANFLTHYTKGNMYAVISLAIIFGSLLSICAMVVIPMLF